MKEKNFERALPAGYKQALYINAKDIKLGIVLNLIALAVLGIVMAAAIASLGFADKLSLEAFAIDPLKLLVAYFVLFVSMILYTVLHELVHGVAYKTLTGEKLTFGISWSCAYCGVPNIFVYRGAALFSVLAPLVFFGLLFALLTAVALAIIGSSDNAAVLNALYAVYLALTVLQGLHLGGCSGDVYAAWLLCRRFKDERTLIRDTGPEQFFYVPSSDQAI